MANRHGSSTSDFNAGYSRRPAVVPPAPALSVSSLLGEPPIARNNNNPVPRNQNQGQSQNYGNYGGGGGGGDSAGMGYRQEGTNFEEEYDTMMDEFNEYHNNRSRGGDAPMDYDSRDGGSRWSQSTPNAGRNQNDFNRAGPGDMESGGGRRGGSSWTANTNQRDFEDGGSHNRMGNPAQFNQQNFMQNQQMGLQNQGLQGLMGQLGQLDNRQQQSNQSLGNLSAGLMGMMPMTPTQNAFSLLQQQAAAAAAANPMQLLLGNLPAFNSEALGKQLLNAAAAAAGGGTPFGHGLGMGSQMPPPLMGIRTQQDYDKQRSFDRNSSNRSRTSHQRSPNSSRHSDMNRSRDVRGNDQRVERKRPADRFDDADRKRARGREDTGNRVLRTSVGTPGRGRGGGSARDGNRAGRKSETGKDKVVKLTLKAKEEDKDGKSKATDEDKADIKKEPETSEGNEETAVEGKESTEKKSSGDRDAEKVKKKSKYDEFPTSLFVCKVCQKTMNDGGSYESHLNGRAHVSLLEILKERFLKRADLLMAESRLAEEEIGIELERQKRAGKGGGGGNKSKNYCKMCDCNYTMSWGAHKAGIHHRILKEFLHPTCRICDAQFVHRMDWVNHIYSTSHFRKLAELKEAGKDLEEHENIKQGELFALSIEIGQDENPSNCITVRNLDWKVPLKDDLKELLKDDDLGLGLPDGEIIIPEKMDENVAIGEETIVTTVGYCCKVCKIYMTQEKEVEPHLKNKSHFGMYVAYLKKVVRMRKQLADDENALIEGNEAESQETLDEKTIMGVDEEAANDEGRAEGSKNDESFNDGDEQNIKPDKMAVDDESVAKLDVDQQVKDDTEELENLNEESELMEQVENVTQENNADIQLENNQTSGDVEIEIIEKEKQEIEIIDGTEDQGIAMNLAVKGKSPEKQSAPVILKPLPPKTPSRGATVCKPVRGRGKGPQFRGNTQSPAVTRGGNTGRANTRGGNTRGGYTRGGNSQRGSPGNRGSSWPRGGGGKFHR